MPKLTVLLDPGQVFGSEVDENSVTVSILSLNIYFFLQVRRLVLTLARHPWRCPSCSGAHCLLHRIPQHSLLGLFFFHLSHGE